MCIFIILVGRRLDILTNLRWTGHPRTELTKRENDQTNQKKINYYVKLYKETVGGCN